MNKLSLIGRIFYALPFAIFGLNHFFMQSFFSGLITTFIPGGKFITLLTGIILMAASIFIMAGKHVKYATLTLAILLSLFILTIHIPNLLNPESINPEFIYTEVYQGTKMNMFIWINLLKDISLLGGALMILGTFKTE